MTLLLFSGSGAGLLVSLLGDDPLSRMTPVAEATKELEDAYSDVEELLGSWLYSTKTALVEEGSSTPVGGA